MKCVYLAAIALALTSCRSQKIAVASVADSVSAGSVRIESFRSVQEADSSASDSYVGFLPEGGEISIMPSGIVSMKGVAKARIASASAHSLSESASESADSVCFTRRAAAESGQMSSPAFAGSALRAGSVVSAWGAAALFIIIFILFKVWQKLSR